MSEIDNKINEVSEEVDLVLTKLDGRINAKQDKIDDANKLPAGSVEGLATVATTGSYNDLSDQPTIPAAASDAKITITQGGATKGSFTLNQAGDATIDLDAGGGGAVDDRDYLCFQSFDYDDQKIYLAPYASGNVQSVIPTLEYSYDKKTWIPLNWHADTKRTDEIVLAHAGDKAYLRGDNAGISDPDDINKKLRFKHEASGNKNINVSGNIMSLLDKTCSSKTITSRYCFNGLFFACSYFTFDGIKLPATKLSEYCFYKLFDNCSGLITAPELPADYIHKGSYKELFSQCHNLVTAPKLSHVKTINAESFSGMFGWCGSLQRAPELPVKITLSDHCFEGMFRSTGLRETPELPWTNLQIGCFSSMFESCSHLVKAHDLPAENVPDSAYESMFGYCRKLTEPPKISAKKLGNSSLNHMFNNCESMTYAPEIMADEYSYSCLFNIFNRCIGLKFIKTNLKSWTDANGNLITENWCTEVPGPGTFICPKELDVSLVDASHIPPNFTVVNGGNLTDDDSTLTKSADVNATCSTYFLNPSGSNVPIIKADAVLTLSASAEDVTKVAYCECVIDVPVGGSVAADDSIYLVDIPIAGMRNNCVARWSNGKANLYVITTEQIPA